MAAADADGDLQVTLDEMRAVYRKAQLVTADMNFSISHSTGPAVTTPMAGTAGCLTGSSWANRKSTTRQKRWNEQLARSQTLRLVSMLGSAFSVLMRIELENT